MTKAGGVLTYMFGCGDALRSKCFAMIQHLVADFGLVQTVNEFKRDRNRYENIRPASRSEDRI